ncbi:FxSxx-COOH system tetratricopeptide repeat protein [Kitasatospora sp. NPDC054939]
MNELAGLLREWIDASGLSVDQIHRRLRPEHFRPERVPSRDTLYRRFAGAGIDTAFVGAIVEICSEASGTDSADLRRKAVKAYALLEAATTCPTPVAPGPLTTRAALRAPSEVDAPAGLVDLTVHHRIFVGRTEELRVLEAAVERGPGRAVAVHGLGGVGKTALVAHYAATRTDRYNPIWTVAADTPASIDQGLADLARALHPALAFQSATPTERDTEVQKQWALQWLATHDGWLLILDGLDDPAQVQRLLARRPSGHVVATSRRTSGWHDAATALPLRTLSPHDARDLLSRILTHQGGPADLDGAEELCAELGYLPLALDQAGAYIVHSGVSLRQYLEQLADSPGDTYRHAVDTTGYDRTVARVWAITLDRLAETPLAVHILRVLAWYAPAGIPVDLLDRIGREPAVRTALARLEDHSMVARSRDTLSVHGLVRALVRTPEDGDPHRSPEAVAGARADAVRLLSLALPKAGPLAAPTVRRLLPHIDALFRNSIDLDPLPSADGLFLGTAASLNGQDLRHRAMPYLEHLLDSCERALGHTHLSTLSVRVALGSACEETGDLARAKVLFASALAGRRTVLGPNAPQTIVARIHLAGAHGTAGDIRLAVEQLSAVHQHARQVLGPDDPHTLLAVNNLAQAHASAERPDRAITLYEQLLTKRAVAVERDPLRTLTVRSNLARAFHSAGRLDEAIREYTEVSEEITRRFGGNHPRTLGIDHNRAFAHAAAGDLAEAVPLYERTAAGRARVLGKDHPDTLTTRSDLAMAYNDIGDARALPLAEAVLEDRRRVLPPNHPDTLNSVNNLATCCSDAGDTARARARYEEALQGREEVLGADHPDTLTTRSNLGCLLVETGEFAAALPHLKAVLDTRLRVLGNDHPETIGSRGTLGGAYRLAGDTDRALPHYRKAFTEARRVFGEEHPLTRRIRARLDTME